jgi:elongator complex protein 4
LTRATGKLHIKFKFIASPAIERSTKEMLRIGIFSLGAQSSTPSPVRSFSNGNLLQAVIMQFMHALRGMIRYSFAACVVTLPAHIVSTLPPSWMFSVDTAIAMSGFDSSDHPYFIKEYHGTFEILKHPRLNCLMLPIRSAAAAQQATANLAFKCRRRKFCIETLHLPPELGEDVSRTQGSSLGTCSSSW